MQTRAWICDSQLQHLKFKKKSTPNTIFPIYIMLLTLLIIVFL